MVQAICWSDERQLAAGFGHPSELAGSSSSLTCAFDSVTWCPLVKEMPRAPCARPGCSTAPSYCVAGGRKAEFCSKHARAGMVNVKHKPCGIEGCSITPNFGVSGSKKAEFCSEHARAGMVDVRHKKCGKEGCSTRPHFGVLGSSRAEFCAEHARAGMVDVKNKKCGSAGCSKQPNFGVEGSGKAEFCAQHAKAGMANVRSTKCRNESCSKQPFFGVKGSRKAEFCAEHAGVGMVNVKNKKCGKEGCFTIPYFGVAGSEKAEFCVEHAKAGMVDVKHKKCGVEDCPKKGKFGVDGIEKMKLCRQHATAMASVSDTAELAQSGSSPNHGLADNGDGSVAGGWGRKRNRSAGAGSRANGDVDSPRSVRASARRSGTRPLRVSGHPMVRFDKVSREVETGIKAELVVASPARAGGGAVEPNEMAASPSYGSSVNGSSSSSGNEKRLRRMRPVSGHPVVAVDGMVVAEAEADVKLEFGSVPSLSLGLQF